VAAAIALMPTMAWAQKLDGDEGRDRDRWERDVRDRGTQALYKLADMTHQICDAMPDDDPDKWRCGPLLWGVTGAATVMGGGSNLVADAFTSYCSAAEIFYGLQDLLWSLEFRAGIWDVVGMLWDIAIEAGMP